MKIDTHFFHDVCIYILYGSAVVLAFILIERLVYYGLLGLRAGAAGAALGSANPDRISQFGQRRDLISRSVSRYLKALAVPGASRSKLEDLSAALYIEASERIGARLWILDTIVTAAPLLGLLGTILGIMDTFSALSSGGISDPAAVSRGIAAALVATAIGIGVALLGLLAHNLLHRMSEYLIERFKSLLLLSETGPTG